MALSEAYSAYTQRQQYCALGSVKPNIGHLDTAAGIAGCIKVAMSLKHKTIAPSINYVNPNPDIDFAHSPFFVPTKSMPWLHQDAQHPRRAALSSFGIGGTNAHAILEEFVEDAGEEVVKSQVQPYQQSDANQSVYCIPISAKNSQRLQAYLEKLVAFIERHVDGDASTNSTMDLASLSYTLQVGRRGMDTRLVVLTESFEQLLEQLQQMVNWLDAKDGKDAKWMLFCTGGQR